MGTQLEYHFGMPVLRELEMTTVARIALGPRLQDSVIVHPRYVPPKMDHELLSARMYHRGRTIDIFLEEPIEIDGKQYGILNFKGVGAEADRSMVLRPGQWYEGRPIWSSYFPGQWIFLPEADSDRVWGGAPLEDAEEEYTDPLFSRLGLAYSPYIKIHQIPPEVVERIGEAEGSSPIATLGQIVRAQQTNIRVRDRQKKYSLLPLSYGLPCEQAAELDAIAIRAVMKLAREGFFVQRNGDMGDNRLLDGVLTDKENYTLVSDSPISSVCFIDSLIDSTRSGLLPYTWVSLDDYFYLLAGKTGIPKDVLINNDGLFYQEMQSILENAGISGA